MDLQLQILGEELKQKPDAHMMALLDEINMPTLQPIIENYSNQIANSLIAAGESYAILFEQNSSRKRLIEYVICKEASRRWREMKTKEIEFANQ